MPERFALKRQKWSGPEIVVAGKPLTPKAFGVELKIPRLELSLKSVCRDSRRGIAFVFESPAMECGGKRSATPLSLRQLRLGTNAALLLRTVRNTFNIPSCVVVPTLAFGSYFPQRY
jgi:hypothetical protein